MGVISAFSNMEQDEFPWGDTEDKVEIEKRAGDERPTFGEKASGHGRETTNRQNTSLDYHPRRVTEVK